MALSATIQLSSAWSAFDRRFVVHLFEGHLSIADMDRLDALGRRWEQDNPGKRVELVIIYPTDARMNGEERTRMGKLIKRGERERAASATVILAEGLLGAMQRSVLTGLQLIVPPVHPQKVFGAVAPAVAWLVPHVQQVNGGDVTAASLAAAVDDLRRAFDARER